MVEYVLNLDGVFGSLADPTRRDILRQVAQAELSVGEIAKGYNLSFAAISKHLKVLEQAKLIIKRRQGRQAYIRLAPAALVGAEAYLAQYAVLVSQQLDQLADYLNKEK